MSIRWSIQIKKNRQRLYLYTHISYISYTYPIHITLVVPSRQCLFTYWNHQQCCWFLYVETCNFGETNPQYRVPEIACQVTHVLMTYAGIALVWREHKCMWLSKQKMFSIQKQSLFFFLIRLFVNFFPYSFQYRRNSERPSTQLIHFCRRSAVETIISLGPCTLR